MTLTGTASISTGSKLLHGTGTLFLTELAQGDSVTCGTFTGIVDKINDDGTAKFKTAATEDVVDQPITKN